MTPESTPTWLVGPEIPPARRIGTVLNGTYRLDAFLGQGLTGITYNAWHLRQKQPFAVKLLHRDLQPSHERVVKLRQDLRVLAGLRKKGFLPVELSFAPDGAPFLASELLIGETLRERLSRGPLPSLAAGIVVAALARALSEAHKLNVVHGDLRPENVLLPSEDGREIEAGQPVLMDAALHHLRRRPIGLDESLPLHKLAYLAPEQTAGEQSTANAAGDMFALGAMLYECLTGKAAFAADELEVVYEKLSQPPAKLDLPKEVGAPPGLASALDAVIAKACARNADDRYASMADFLEDLSNAFSGADLPLPPADERIAIDTVQSQNRGLRKRTVAVKRIGAGPEPAAASQTQAKPVASAAPGKSTSGELSKPTAVSAVKAPEAKRASGGTGSSAVTAAPAASAASASSSGVAAIAAGAAVSGEIKAARASGELRTGEFKRVASPAPAVASKPASSGPASSVQASTAAAASDGKTGEFKRVPLPSASAAAKPTGSGQVAAPALAKAADSRPSYPDVKTGEFKRVPLPAAESKNAPQPRETPGPAATNERRTGEIKKAAAQPESRAATTAAQPASQPATVGKVVATAKGAAEAAKAAEAARLANAAKPDEGGAKARPIRRTVKARDLSGLLADVAAGRLDAAMAIAMAGMEDDEGQPATSSPQSEEQRIIEEGRAAVLARAEAAKRNRQAEAEEMAQRAQEQQRRILEQARQETLSRMRAEMATQARSGAASATDDAADPELLAEAERQREQLEKARQEAERQAALEEERARKEAEAAEQARLEAERVEAALRDAEEREAARAEAMRKEAEREQEARRAAEAAEAERVQHLREAEEAERLLAEAKQRADEAAREAEEARRAAEAEADVIAWEEGVVEVVDQRRPPPTPVAALRQKSQVAQAAQEAAEQAAASVREVAMRVDAAREQAEALARTIEDAQREAEEAAAARDAEAKELAKAVAAAEAARARDNELLRLAAAANERAQAAEAARAQHATRATRVTQALAVLQQVQDMAQSQGSSRGTPASGAPAANAAPAGTSQTGSGSGVVPVPASAATARGVEPSGIYAGYSVSEALRDPSGIQRDMPAAARAQASGQVARPEFTGPYQPGQMSPALQQATQSPTRPMNVVSGQPEPQGDVVEISAMLPASSLAAMVGMHTQSQTAPLPGAMLPATMPQAMPLLPGMTGPTTQIPATGPHPQLMMAPMMPQVPMPPVDTGGVTLTVRQFVATLTVTSLLSAIIGALIVILVMRERGPLLASDGRDPRLVSGSTFPPERPAEPGTKPSVGPSTGPATQPGPATAVPSPKEVTSQPDLAVAIAPTIAPPAVSPTVPIEPAGKPTIEPAAATANQYPNKRPASVRLPPLRLLTDQPLLRPRPVVAPAGGAGTAAPQTSPSNTSTPAKETPASAAPSGEPKAPAATEAKPATESKPAAEPKSEPKKTTGTPEDGLRNPFGP
ncbi:MAG: protein kinase [Myxococcales bacterium]|nr:protein kinase [Myxococcales bacterium]